MSRALTSFLDVRARRSGIALGLGLGLGLGLVTSGLAACGGAEHSKITIAPPSRVVVASGSHRIRVRSSPCSLVASRLKCGRILIGWTGPLPHTLSPCAGLRRVVAQREAQVRASFRTKPEKVYLQVRTARTQLKANGEVKVPPFGPPQVLPAEKTTEWRSTSTAATRLHVKFRNGESEWLFCVQVRE
jgi:hypothetical protein